MTVEQPSATTRTHDDRHGPEMFLEYTRTKIQGKEALCCMVCAKSVIVAKARINTEDDNLSPKDAMWREVCLLAQDLPATLSSIVANENRWPHAREDLFHRGKWGALKGQTVRDTRDGRERAGTVVPILPPPHLRGRNLREHT